MTQAFAEHRDRAEALIAQGKQLLKQAALDFGMQFARNLRQDVEILTKQLQESLMQGDEVSIKNYSSTLQTKLNELNQEMLQFPPQIF